MKKIIVFYESGYVGKQLADNFVRFKLAPSANWSRKESSYSLFEIQDTKIEVRNANSAMGVRGLIADEIYIPESSLLSFGSYIYVVRGDSSAINGYTEEDCYVSNY